MSWQGRVELEGKREERIDWARLVMSWHSRIELESKREGRGVGWLVLERKREGKGNVTVHDGP
jgi:hypothetical protein